MADSVACLLGNIWSPALHRTVHILGILGYLELIPIDPMKLFSPTAMHSQFSEDTKGLISEEDCARRGLQRQRSSRTLSIFAGSAAVVTACLLSAFVGLWLGRRYPSDDGAIRHVSKYSKSCLAMVDAPSLH